MFVLCKDNHLGIYWNKKLPIHLEKDSVFLFDRKQCLQELMKNKNKDESVDIITSMMKNPNIWYSF